MSSGSTSIALSKSRGKSTACYCGQRCVILSSWKATSFGRRFRGCPNYWVGEHCDFFEWEDPPTCDYGLRFGKKVVRRLEELQQQLDTFESNHKQRVSQMEAELLVAKGREQELQVLIERLATRERAWRRVSLVCWALLGVIAIVYFVNRGGNIGMIGYPCLSGGSGWSR